MYKLIIALCFILSGCQVEMFHNTTAALDNSSTNELKPEKSTDDSLESTHDVQIYWNAPLDRVNGEIITVLQLGGYELRYKRMNEIDYVHAFIDPNTTQFVVENITHPSQYQFEIAAYDLNGLYSDFVHARLDD